MQIKIIQASSDLGCTAFGARLAPKILSAYLEQKYGIQSMKISCTCENDEMPQNIAKNHINQNINYNENGSLHIIECKNIQKSKDKNDKAKNIIPINICNEKIYHAVLNAKRDGFLPLTIGGDHSIAIASSLASLASENLACKNLENEKMIFENVKLETKNNNLDSKNVAFENLNDNDILDSTISKNQKNLNENHPKNLGIIWIDAHADFNTFDSTITGNIHGMPLATITNNNGTRLTHFHKGNFYKNENVAIIGARDIDKLEKINLINKKIVHFSSKELNNNFDFVMQKSIEIATNNTIGFHVSCDLDVLDPHIAPGVSVRAKNGINKNMLLKILEFLFTFKSHIKSFDFVEFNPAKDNNDKTKIIAYKILDFIVTNLGK